MKTIPNGQTSLSMVVGPLLDILNATIPVSGAPRPSNIRLFDSNLTSNTVSGSISTWSHITDGFYNLGLSATTDSISGSDTSKTGSMILSIQDSTNYLPYKEDFLLMDATAYASLVKGTPAKVVNSNGDVIATNGDMSFVKSAVSGLSGVPMRGTDNVGNIGPTNIMTSGSTVAVADVTVKDIEVRDNFVYVAYRASGTMHVYQREFTQDMIILSGGTI